MEPFSKVKRLNYIEVDFEGEGGDKRVKKLRFIFVLLAIFCLVGCKTQEGTIPSDGSKDPKEDPGMIGYVMQKEGEGILVVDPKAQDFSSTGGVREFYNAIWFSKAPKEINLGHHVKVWFDVVLESYPGQSEVKYIKIIEEIPPQGADLTPAQALNKVLSSEDINELFTVHDINFDQEKGEWTIQLKDIWNEDGNILEFQIQDK